jgi:phosphotransferase system HPr-like phosphotransfer protein
MCLAATKGSKLKVTAEGTDAHEAIYAIGKLFSEKFGESE